MLPGELSRGPPLRQRDGKVRIVQVLEALEPASFAPPHNANRYPEVAPRLGEAELRGPRDRLVHGIGKHVEFSRLHIRFQGFEIDFDPLDSPRGRLSPG